MNKKTIRDIDVRGKRVLVRVDYNVPVASGEVGDTLRIEASFETINYLLDQGCSVVLISHLGEPKGAPEEAYSLRPVAAKASEMLGRPIDFMPDCVGPEVEAEIAGMRPGDIVLLENLRFHQGEMDNDAGFAAKLAAYGEVFVDDAFAVVHRPHASLIGIPKILPAVAGFLVEKEVNTITLAMEHPHRPLLVVVGGVKISTKIKLLSNLMHRADAIMIGGAMANTFLAAQGHPVGKSKYEADQAQAALDIIELSKVTSKVLLLPTDVVISATPDGSCPAQTFRVEDVREDDLILDIGPQSIAAAGPWLKPTSTVIWNGPVGVTEVPAFAEGSRALAKSIIDSGATAIVGGGDTAAFVDEAGLHQKFSWVSTGGGASLELMSGNQLPGVEALLDR